MSTKFNRVTSAAECCGKPSSIRAMDSSHSSNMERIDNLQRRDFLKACMAAAGAAAVGSLAAGCSTEPGIQSNASMELTDSTTSGSSGRFASLVRPIIGTGWNGHTFPGAMVPFGLTQLSPDTMGPTVAKGYTKGREYDFDPYAWAHGSGYYYQDNVILGFSHTHLSGTGGAELGDVLLMPGVGPVRWNSGSFGFHQHEAQLQALGPNSGWVAGEKGYSSRFSHRHETARAGYYRVLLEDSGVLAELTATTRCGMHRYTFPNSDRAYVILDLVHSIGSTVFEAQLNIENATTISGYRGTHGWAPNRQVYFVIEFSRPFESCQVQRNGMVQTGGVGSVQGPKLKAAFSYKTTSEKPLIIKVGISGTGIEGARENLQAEIPHFDFDSIHQQTEQMWDKALAALDAEFSTMEMAQAFYTAAYHGMVGPTTFNDVDGTYRGEDHKNHRRPGFTNYTSISVWGISPEFSFIMLTQPRRTNDIIKTMLADYRELNQHSLPLWPLWGNETWAMVGFPSVEMIVGAYTRGFRGYDVEAVYAAMRDTAMVGAAIFGSEKFQAEFRRYGYVPSGPVMPGEMITDLGKQSVTLSLYCAYDYWCVGAMAELLGKHEDAKMFYKLGQNYKNTFDPKTGFMRGKLPDGKWREPFRPDQEYWQDYTETDAWQATFNVRHDVQGLIDLFGGDEPFIQKLDAFFTAPSAIYNEDADITGMVGQDAQGNEPCNPIPYLYPFAGAAWKTQYWIRKVLALYNNTPNGIPGNDDIGMLSSCLTLGAMGFYPVNAATGVYVIGSPLVHRAKINNPAAGTTFSIIAENNSSENCYIQNARLNGKELTRSWFTHADIVAGGELYFRMGNKPNKEWASAREDRPPSGLVR